MKAVILCAGYGTRLKPITDHTPKPLIKVLGIPLLEYTINLLYQYDVREIYINRHHLPEKFDKVNFPKKVKVHFSTEQQILGTLGGIMSFKEHLLDDDFLVINGDILFDMNIKKLLEQHKKRKCISTMVVRKKDVDDATPVFIDDFNNVISIGGQSRGVYKECMFTGIQVLSPEFFKHVKPAQLPSCIIKDLYIPYISSGGIVNSCAVDDNKEFWLEFGDHKKYLDGNLWVLKKLSEYKLGNIYEDFIDLRSGEQVVENIWLGDKVYVDWGATLIPPVFVGHGVTIEKESIIGPNVVLGDDVTIKEGSAIRDSFIMDGANIPANSKIINRMQHQ